MEKRDEPVEPGRTLMGGDWKDWRGSVPAELPSPLALAYLGDAVYELWVRRTLIEVGVVKVAQLHKQAVEIVRAASQVALLRRIEPFLDDEEKEWVRRGRNADSGRSPRSTDVATYRLSTGFECLVGYWSLARPERLPFLREQLALWLDKRENERGCGSNTLPGMKEMEPK
ncbi:conserved hypothetical protein [Heliomicrobium modesticaldum Ice1]|uniref:Mini-ribonuclease 3 n=1 Tax=Heliobacterium modesticaldum (strain ATCC 51547 / Ice1) TaxID=498761 RepID=B0TC36_HELMI|nr:ribonuclease III domain-containing protein [Heliomicrobium modesticaldum]ABZ83935.1 conserved hypothetical protein [Heliomicrobium modesticaldum Ice1]